MFKLSFHIISGIKEYTYMYQDVLILRGTFLIHQVSLCKAMQIESYDEIFVWPLSFYKKEYKTVIRAQMYISQFVCNRDL